MGVLGVRQHGTRGKELVANLTQQDRCDRCPAAAGAVIVLRSKPGVLLFCNHHLNQHEAKLAEIGAGVYRKDSK